MRRETQRAKDGRRLEHLNRIIAELSTGLSTTPELISGAAMDPRDRAALHVKLEHRLDYIVRLRGLLSA